MYFGKVSKKYLQRCFGLGVDDMLCDVLSYRKIDMEGVVLIPKPVDVIGHQHTSDIDIHDQRNCVIM